MCEENIKEMLKMYFDINNDIKVLKEKQDEIKADLKNFLNKSGVDALKTSLGSISYVEKKYQSIDKDLLNKILNDTQKKEVFTEKLTKYIKITENKKGE